MERGKRKTRIGVVVSNTMAKTVVVKVERRVADRKYGKIGCKVWIMRGEVLPQSSGARPPRNAAGPRP